jgi:hypothetical protein
LDRLGRQNDVIINRHMRDRILQGGLDQPGFPAQHIKGFPEGDLARIQGNPAVGEFGAGIRVDENLDAGAAGQLSDGVGDRHVLADQANPRGGHDVRRVQPLLDPGHQLLGPAASFRVRVVYGFPEGI